MTAPLALEWREMRDEDRNYILSSWLRSYAEISTRRRRIDFVTREVEDPGGEFAGMNRSTFFGLYEPVVQALVARSLIAIAWTPELPDSVLGWMALEPSEPKAVHYLLVKPRWRKLGIATWMLKDLRGEAASYTHAPHVKTTRLLGSAWTHAPMLPFERKAA